MAVGSQSGVPVRRREEHWCQKRPAHLGCRSVGAGCGAVPSARVPFPVIRLVREGTAARTGLPFCDGKAFLRGPSRDPQGTLGQRGGGRTTPQVDLDGRLGKKSESRGSERLRKVGGGGCGDRLGGLRSPACMSAHCDFSFFPTNFM